MPSELSWWSHLNIFKIQNYTFSVNGFDLGCRNVELKFQLKMVYNCEGPALAAAAGTGIRTHWWDQSRRWNPTPVPWKNRLREPVVNAQSYIWVLLWRENILSKQEYLLWNPSWSEDWSGGLTGLGLCRSVWHLWICSPQNFISCPKQALFLS